MRAQDLIPLPRLQRAEQESIDDKSKLEAMERSQFTLKREQIQVEATLREMPMRRRTQLAEIDRNVSSLDQELAEAESRRKIVISAPYDGVVTALQAEKGSSAQANIPLMSVVPAGSDLLASLYGSSRAIGFVRPGQKVSVRYQAYPYQKFGSYVGTVASVSKSAINPAELPQQLAGLYAPTESLYRINIKLDRQTATTYGKPAPLQAGMQLEADVITDSRRSDRVDVRAPVHPDRQVTMTLLDRLNLGWGSRLPMVLQTEASECGLACLVMVDPIFRQRRGLAEPSPPFRHVVEGSNAQGRDARRRAGRSRGTAAAAGTRGARAAQDTEHPALGPQSFRRP